MKKNIQKYILLGLTILNIHFFGFSILLFITSFLMFDAPGSELDKSTQLSNQLIMLLPISIIICTIGSWLLYAYTQRKVAILCSIVPYLQLGAAFILFGLL